MLVSYTDNYPSWVSGMETMSVEMISSPQKLNDEAGIWTYVT